MDDDLEARLESHAQAFEGLLSLMPAKQYFGEDVSNQWQRKKQTKEEKKAARKAKLDPANQKTAKDVLDENEKKRKRELGMDSGDEAEASAHMDTEEDDMRQVKKTKTNGKAPTAEEIAVRNKEKAEKRKEKRERKKERVEKKKEKIETKKVRKQEQDLDELEAEGKVDAVANGSEDELEEADGDDVDAMDLSGLADVNDTPIEDEQSSVPTSPEIDSPAFDVSADHSAASSSSSIVPPATAPSPRKMDTTETTAAAEPTKAKKEKAFNMPKIDSEELQSRLRARIEELRARRKADGPEGNAPRSRQDLLDARRKKSEARKQHKKELRVKAKQEEERINNERLRGSGSPLSADIFSPRIEQNNFSFGRVAFEDGQETDPSLGGINDARKRKGPQDPKTALELAQKKAARLSGYDETKRADIEEKDLWLNAKKRAHGERVRDDQSLLKKALKRKEKGKAKSEKEWNERIEGVRHGKEMRQKKREDNLAKRKDDKGSKKGKGKGAKGGKGKPKARPGFEGSRR